MRAEFAAISAGFDTMPRITTTGLFNTIFAQSGNYTFTLPPGPGTLALAADVATAVAPLAPLASPHLTGNTVIDLLDVGTGGAALSNNPSQVTGNVNAFLQVGVQNMSAGNAASSNLVVTANDGSDATWSANLGINGSGNAEAGFTIVGAHGAYCYASNGPFAVGTASASDYIFFTGGTLAANERGRISGTTGLLTGPAFAALVPGYLFGMTLSNDGGAPNTVIDISAGFCADSTGTALITLGAFTKSIAGTWARGSGANGMGSGLTATLSTWYHVFAIINGGLADVYFDTSVTAANRPASTTAFRRIGSIRLDGSVHILAFVQNGDEFLWATTPQDVTTATLTTANRTLYALTVPPGVKCNALLRAQASNPGNILAVWLMSPDETDQAVSGTSDISGITGTTLSSGRFNVRTNTSSQIGARAINASTTLSVGTFGWIDTRGRFS
jgi:hypothetical protein